MHMAQFGFQNFVTSWLVWRLIGGECPDSLKSNVDLSIVPSMGRSDALSSTIRIVHVQCYHYNTRYGNALDVQLYRVAVVATCIFSQI